MSKRPHITETTRKNLMDAFWKLYLTKPVEKISVREITDIAGYNRGTFYLYFKDVYDVLEQIENDVLEVVEREAKRYAGVFCNESAEVDISAATSAAVDIFECCDYKPFILLSDRGDPRFEKAIKEKMHKHIEAKVNRNTNADETTKEYIIHFMVSGILGIIKKWYGDGMVIPMEEHLAAVCNVLLGPRNMINKQLNKKD